MKIVIALDDSPFSDRVIEAVCERQWTADTQFAIVTVVEPLTYTQSNSDAWADLAIESHSRRMQSADRLCSNARKKITSSVPGCIVHYEVREGSPRQEILEAAIDWSADKIVLGSHGRSARPHLLLGSVSREVTRSFPCSVEVVRPKRPRPQAIA